MSGYKPPFSITPAIISLIEDIGEELGRYSGQNLSYSIKPFLKRLYRIRTVQATCEIEGNTLKQEHVTALLAGKRIVGPYSEVEGIRNTLLAYKQIKHLQPNSLEDMKEAHKIIMNGLMDHPGTFREGGVEIESGKDIIHFAPPAKNVPFLINDLFYWLRNSNDHPLIRSSLFYYEFESIHPFNRGNGCLGRLWLTLLLVKWKPLFNFVSVESIINDNRNEFFTTLRRSTETGQANPFIVFMLEVIRKAVAVSSGFVITPQVAPQVTPQVKQLLEFLLKRGSASLTDIGFALELSDRKNLMSSRINPALRAGVIERTIPEKPRSRNQQYRLTEIGVHVSG